MALVLREDRGGVVNLILNRADQHNALSKDLISELQEALDSEAKRARSNKTRALFISSASEKAFCAGADLKERIAMKEAGVRRALDQLRDLMDSIDNFPVPTFAILDGVAFGGGLEMALACDFRMASPKAQVGLTETKLAIIPGAGGTQRLPRLIGEAKAKEWIFRAKRVNAEEAYATGLFHFLGEKPFEEASRWAEDILACGPVAILEAKQSIHKGRGLVLEKALDKERECYEGVLSTDDRLEALKAFTEKRPAKFQGK
jgi:enoyl-CoA hydratase/carnithine racemase